LALTSPTSGGGSSPNAYPVCICLNDLMIYVKCVGIFDMWVKDFEVQTSEYETGVLITEP
jgi:hypothetical protein